MLEFRKYGTDSKMDKLVDGYSVDRHNAAEQSYGLEKLINDEDAWVRQAVARQKYGLDILIDDRNWTVRCVVASQGYGLDKLVNDRNWCVREKVAGHGYGLDKLINDIDSSVRMEVAKQGYGLDVLINDKANWVRDEVINYLKEHGYRSIAEWAIVNPNKVHKADIKDLKTQEGIEDFIYKLDSSTKLKVESSYDNIDEFFNTHSSSSNDSNELIIRTVDTKQIIIKIQKTLKENKTNYKFIVDIAIEGGDSFIIKTIIKSKEQLNSKIQETIEFLKSQKEFSEYVDNLESCL